MAVNRETERVKLTLQDGTEAEVRFYKRLTAREQIEVMRAAGSSIQSGRVRDDEQLSITFEALDVYPLIYDRIWADSNYTLEDVDGDSMFNYVSENLARFLGTAKPPTPGRGQAPSLRGADE